MESLEKFLKADTEKSPDLTNPWMCREIMVIPEDGGGGSHVVIPSLGRYFALADGDHIPEALAGLESFMQAILYSPEYVKEYGER